MQCNQYFMLIGSFGAVTRGDISAVNWSQNPLNVSQCLVQ